MNNLLDKTEVMTVVNDLWTKHGHTMDAKALILVTDMVQNHAAVHGYASVWAGCEEFLTRLETREPGQKGYPASLNYLTYLMKDAVRGSQRAAGAKNGLPATPAPRNIDWASQANTAQAGSTLASGQPENVTTGWTMEVRGRSATNEATTELDKATSQRVAHLDSIKTRLQAAKETVRPLAGHVASEKEISQLAGVVMMSPQEEWEPALALWVTRRETRQPGDSFYPSNGHILQFYMRLAREENKKAC